MISSDRGDMSVNAQEEMKPERPHILLGVTGSVATIKLPILVRLLLQLGDVRIVTTDAAKHFVDEAQVPDEAMPVWGDSAEWHTWQHIGDPVIHIDLRRWADVLVIAPLSANSLAKLANGLSDNLLTCIVRAWDFRNPLLVAPAMNTFMWENPFTARHLKEIQSFGVVVIPPMSKTLACGDTGMGAMAQPANIAEAVQAALEKRSAQLTPQP